MLALIFNIINRKYTSKSSKKLTEKAQPTLKTFESPTPTGQSCLTLSRSSGSLIHGHISCHHSENNKCVLFSCIFERNAFQ